MTHTRTTKRPDKPAVSKQTTEQITDAKRREQITRSLSTDELLAAVSVYRELMALPTDHRLEILFWLQEYTRGTTGPGDLEQQLARYGRELLMNEYGDFFSEQEREED
jgi:hypothetical protein